MSSVRELTVMTLGEPYDLPVRGKVVELTSDQISRLKGDNLMGDGGLAAIGKATEVNSRHGDTDRVAKRVEK